MSRFSTLILVLLLFVFGAGALAPAFLSHDGKSPLPVLGEIPTFSLNESSGKVFGLEQLKGKVSVVNFFFTSCPSVCPVLMGKVADLHKRFRNNPQVQFISISVDPSIDTPEALAKYADKFGGPSDRWHYLRGDLSEVAKLSTAFKFGTIEDPNFHSQRLVLVDYMAQARASSALADKEEIKSFVLDTVAMSTELTRKLKGRR